MIRKPAHAYAAKNEVLKTSVIALAGFSVLAIALIRVLVLGVVLPA